MEGQINPNYIRVSPRDLFNEGKLLKCLGQLSLLILDGDIWGIECHDDGRPFKVGLHDAGYLVAVQGIRFTVQGKALWLGTTYNSRSNYPLVCALDDLDFPVFEDDGSISPAFRYFLQATSTQEPQALVIENIGGLI